MSRKQEMLEKAKEILTIQSYYSSAGALMGWDLWQGLSQDGIPFRQQVSGYFTRQAREHLANSETAQVVDFLRGLSDADFDHIYERGAARLLIRQYDRACKIPPDLQVEMNTFTSQAQVVWRDCLQRADFKSYKPYIRHLFELKKRVALALDDSRSPFDVLVGEVDAGLTSQKTDEIFSVLKTEVSKIVRQVRAEHDLIDDSVLRIDMKHDLKKQIALDLVEQTGFDMDKSNFSEVQHPMCTSVGPRDSRITTNYRNLFAGIFSTLHESGHARYNYRSNDQAVEWGVWGGIGGAMHESQSRFIENMIGRSREFWQYFYPQIQKQCAQLTEISLDQFYRAVTKSSPGTQRMSADELTYCLHPIIRYEMEKDYFTDQISTDDFEEIWNEKYQQLLGVCPKNAAEGVLQDIHWASGHVGYFQSYALGDVYAGQFRHQMLQEVPDVYNAIAQGDFSSMNTWCTDKIHQYGKAYNANELLVAVTGEELNPQYFIDYLKQKFCSNN